MHPEADKPQVQAAPQKVVQAAQAPAQRENEADALMANTGGIASDDPIELEEKFHEPNDMVSMKCIEAEVEYLSLMCQLSKRDGKQDELEFFEFRKESLQFQKESIETNIETGVTTPESYTADLKGYLAAQKKLMMEANNSLGANNQHS